MCLFLFEIRKMDVPNEETAEEFIHKFKESPFFKDEYIYNTMKELGNEISIKNDEVHVEQLWGNYTIKFQSQIGNTYYDSVNQILGELFKKYEYKWTREDKSLRQKISELMVYIITKRIFSEEYYMGLIFNAFEYNNIFGSEILKHFITTGYDISAYAQKYIEHCKKWNNEIQDTVLIRWDKLGIKY